MSGPDDSTSVYRERVVDGVVILSLRRSLRGMGEAGLRDRIDECVRLGQLQILMDLSEVPFIDSTELGRLIRCHLSVRQAGGRVRLFNVPERVLSLLRMSRLETVLDVYPTEVEALAAVRTAASPEADA
jgi:anti-sigma B factor antagonist